MQPGTDWMTGLTKPTMPDAQPGLSIQAQLKFVVGFPSHSIQASPAFIVGQYYLIQVQQTFIAGDYQSIQRRLSPTPEGSSLSDY